mmetsp:Transcript_7935/g.29609  ORF Transcript_7935/g.29609 Transcript_7935/m.29609 type:complete len:294 (-) Transcript_7935:598-1479(-)
MLCVPTCFCINGQKTQCPKGRVAVQAGSTVCVPCEIKGTYTDQFRSSCIPCPLGSYCIHPDQDPIPCPNSTYTEKTGSHSKTQCQPQYCPQYYRCEVGVVVRMPQKEIEEQIQKEKDRLAREKAIRDAQAAAEKEKAIITVVSVLSCISLCVMCCICLCASGTLCGCVSAVLHKARTVVKHRTELAAKLLEGFEKDVEMDELDEDVNRAKLMIKKSLLEIDFKELKLLKKIGSGGSESVVFKAEWNQLIVAIKVFNVRRLTGERHFEEFEKELSIMSGLRHPRLVTFYGVSLQ